MIDALHKLLHMTYEKSMPYPINTRDNSIKTLSPNLFLSSRCKVNIMEDLIELEIPLILCAMIRYWTKNLITTFTYIFLAV